MPGSGSVCCAARTKYWRDGAHHAGWRQDVLWGCGDALSRGELTGQEIWLNAPGSGSIETVKLNCVIRAHLACRELRHLQVSGGESGCSEAGDGGTGRPVEVARGGWCSVVRLITFQGAVERRPAIQQWVYNYYKRSKFLHL